jgi:hypothetical protein
VVRVGWLVVNCGVCCEVWSVLVGCELRCWLVVSCSVFRLQAVVCYVFKLSCCANWLRAVVCVNC